MVYATKENNEQINRVARLSCLSRKQVMQVLGNKRKRLKAEGSTVEELKGIKEEERLTMQLKELQKSLKQCVAKRRCPAGLKESDVKEVTRLMVCNSSCSTSTYHIAGNA
jgi:hypothetical protein